MKTITPAAIGLVVLLCLTPVTRAADPPAAAGKKWQSVTDELFKKIGVYDIKPIFIRRCVGMIVAPNGDIFVVTSKGNGVCVSRDQGRTWAVVEGNKVTGRCETGFGFSVAYPYDGRMAFFTIDGSGGMSLDAGKTWRPFGKILRMFDYADVDWATKEPKTLFGLLHEPFFTVLSTDGGHQWTQIHKDAESPQNVQKTTKQYRLGVINATTLVRFHPDRGEIEMTTDAGKTWTAVAKHKVRGLRPVHYGKKVYWTTTEGVIVSENGRDWTLVGSKLEQPVYGPYFGKSEDQMMVVSSKGFFVTRDGAKTWKNVAAPFSVPDGITKRFETSGSFCYFGWDANNNILYAAQLGSSCYSLNLAP